MIYIHKYADMNIKNADIECVPLMRSIKIQLPRLPKDWTVEHIKPFLVPFFVQPSHITTIEQAQILVAQLIEEIKMIDVSQPVFESGNIARLKQQAQEFVQPLATHKSYFENILHKQETFADDIFRCMCLMKQANNSQKINEKMNDVFFTLLHSTNMTMKADDLIWDHHTKSIHAVQQAMDEGFLFTMKLEHQLQKVPFSIRKKNIPVSYLQINDQISTTVNNLVGHIDNTYAQTMQLITLAVHMYALIRLAQ